MMKSKKGRQAYLHVRTLIKKKDQIDRSRAKSQIRPAVFLLLGEPQKEPIQEKRNDDEPRSPRFFSAFQVSSDQSDLEQIAAENKQRIEDS